MKELNELYRKRAEYFNTVQALEEWMQNDSQPFYSTFRAEQTKLLDKTQLLLTELKIDIRRLHYTLMLEV